MESKSQQRKENIREITNELYRIGDSSTERWDVSLLIRFDDCAASSINKAATKSKSDKMNPTQSWG